ncbi:hypothetical protein BDN72DRAFT_882457 [Pluteus cervinus]|uniref:Uncharacterized protein n=1 Tax=Pluteus cervinus TaxID=181527 RepID=A0ACD3ABQ7_9AGAR|nr:hypothetical protein BDN72DRAFT_882457 [Pluteus cervinus]
MFNDIVEHARKKIDAEILVLRERIRSLRSSRNALSPIHRLPPEVMAQIFLSTALSRKSGRKWALRCVPSKMDSSHPRFTTLEEYGLDFENPRSGPVALSFIDSVNYGEQKLWDTQDFQELVVAALPRVRNLWLDHSLQSTPLSRTQQGFPRK